MPAVHGRYFATNFDPEINFREFKKVWTWINRKWVERPVHSERWDYDFPVVGSRPVYLNGHDELHSLSKNIDAKSIRFWMGFGDHYLNVFGVLRNLGMLSEKPVTTAEGVEVVPLKVLKAVLPDPASLAKTYKGWTCIADLVKGWKDGKWREVLIYNNCDHAKCYREVESQAISYTAGVPPIAAAILVARGEWAPHTMVNVEELDPDPFLKQLGKMGLPTKIEDQDAQERQAEQGRHAGLGHQVQQHHQARGLVARSAAADANGNGGAAGRSQCVFSGDRIANVRQPPRRDRGLRLAVGAVATLGSARSLMSNSRTSATMTIGLADGCHSRTWRTSAPRRGRQRGRRKDRFGPGRPSCRGCPCRPGTAATPSAVRQRGTVGTECADCSWHCPPIYRVIRSRHAACGERLSRCGEVAAISVAQSSGVPGSRRPVALIRPTRAVERARRKLARQQPVRARSGRAARARRSSRPRSRSGS